MAALKWIAEWPPVQRISDGSLSMSVDPFADYHLIYAVAPIAPFLASADGTWGVGSLWASCRSSH